jgi:hypothetical protein
MTDPPHTHSHTNTHTHTNTHNTHTAEGGTGSMASGTDGGSMEIGSEWREVLTSNGSAGWQRKSAWEANTARILDSEEMRHSQVRTTCSHRLLGTSSHF